MTRSVAIIALVFVAGLLTGLSGESKKITAADLRGILGGQCVNKQEALAAIERYLPDLKDQPVTGHFGLDTINFEEKKRISATDMREVLRMVVNRC